MVLLSFSFTAYWHETNGFFSRWQWYVWASLNVIGLVLERILVARYPTTRDEAMKLAKAKARKIIEADIIKEQETSISNELSSPAGEDVDFPQDGTEQVDEKNPLLRTTTLTRLQHQSSLVNMRRTSSPFEQVADQIEVSLAVTSRDTYLAPKDMVKDVITEEDDKDNQHMEETLEGVLHVIQEEEHIRSSTTRTSAGGDEKKVVASKINVEKLIEALAEDIVVDDATLDKNYDQVFWIKGWMSYFFLCAQMPVFRETVDWMWLLLPVDGFASYCNGDWWGNFLLYLVFNGCVMYILASLGVITGAIRRERSSGESVGESVEHSNSKKAQ